MKTAEVVSHFLLDCSVTLSPQTLRWYEYHLTRWVEVAPDQLEEVRPLHITTYLTQRKAVVQPTTGKPLSSHTLHGDAQVIARFLRWAVAQEYLDRFNFQALKMPKIEQKVIEVFSPAQIRQMLQACKQEPSPWLVARDRAIILFLLDTGVRSAELCGLTLDRLSIGTKTARVMGKGRKERDVGYGAQTAQQLALYIRRYRRADPGVEALFTNKRGEGLTGSGLDQMLYRLEAWTTISGIRVSAHTFRHTFAVTYLSQGGDVHALSKLLGHTSIETTELYLRAMTAKQVIKQRPSVVDTLFTQ